MLRSAPPHPPQGSPFSLLPPRSVSPSPAPSRSSSAPSGCCREAEARADSYLPPLPGRRRARSCSPQITAPAFPGAGRLFN